jgi:hypothetical protein
MREKDTEDRRLAQGRLAGSKAAWDEFCDRCAPIERHQQMGFSESDPG